MKINDTLTIIKKEFTRFFSDRSMVFTTVIMPGLLIYIIYSLMGDNMSESNFTVEATEPTTVYVENLPPSILPLFDSIPMNIVTHDIVAEDVMNQLKDKENNIAYMIFPENFDSLVANYDPASETLAPNIKIFYNSVNDGSSMTYHMLDGALNAYEDSFCNRFDVNRYDDADSPNFDQSDESEVISNVLSQLIPMLLLMLLFSGCMVVGPTSIAGEKERGTIATLLVTPMKRSQLALGKIISLSVFATLSGLSSFIGIILSLPKMLHADELNMDTNLYSASEYILLLLVLLSTVLVLISVIANLSAIAKDVKQASTINIPVSLTMIVVGMMPMIMGGATENPILYLIPFYNSVMAMTAVMAHEATVLTLVLTICSNLVYAGLGAWILTKLFDSEKVMFGK